jgi:membrane protein YqaA with SNARE-associated domain
MVARLYALFLHFGGLGLLALGVLDSSLLIMPLANDLLLVAMTARQAWLLPYYVVMATAGSVLGCALTDLVCRKGGEEGLEKHVSRRRLKYVKARVREDAAWAVGFASLMPPPFPFTAFIAAAAALGYPRRKLLTVVGITRLVRFLAEGLLAIVFGTRILQLARLPIVQHAVVALIVISVGASAVSLSKWVRRSREFAGH